MLQNINMFQPQYLHHSATYISY